MVLVDMKCFLVEILVNSMREMEVLKAFLRNFVLPLSLWLSFTHGSLLRDVLSNEAYRQPLVELPKNLIFPMCDL